MTQNLGSALAFDVELFLRIHKLLVFSGWCNGVSLTRKRPVGIDRIGQQSTCITHDTAYSSLCNSNLIMSEPPLMSVLYVVVLIIYFVMVRQVNE